MPKNPDLKSPCPKCGAREVYHVVRKTGEKWYQEGFKAHLAKFYECNGVMATALIPFTQHDCRNCRHSWMTKVQGRDEKWRAGYKTPVEPFQVDCILPHHVCSCGADYGLLTRKRGLTAKFCPYCGESASKAPAEKEE